MPRQCSCWDLRFSVTDELTHYVLINKFKVIAKKWVFQKEQGEKTGYIHFQCRISLIKKAIKNSLLALFEEGMEPQYCEPTIKDNYTSENVFYVMKEQTRIAGPWKSTDPPSKFVPIQFRHIKELYPFQEDVISKKHYNFRNVNCIIDDDGDIGKSTLAFIAYLKKDALYCPPMNDAQKIIEFIYCKLENVENENVPDMFIFDLPRSMSKECLFGMYSAIEQIKNGYLYDTRYKGRDRWINSPDIWVFTNIPPDTSRLSADRWNLWTVSKKRELKKYIKEVELPKDDKGDVEIIRTKRYEAFKNKLTI